MRFVDTHGVRHEIVGAIIRAYEKDEVKPPENTISKEEEK